MIPENNNAFNGSDKELKADEGKENKGVKLVNAKISDVASDNVRDTERVLEASKAAVPSYELHLENPNKTIKIEDPQPETQTPLATRNDGLHLEDNNSNETEDLDTETQKPLTIQDYQQRIDENLSGTTNLSLEQLKPS